MKKGNLFKKGLALSLAGCLAFGCLPVLADTEESQEEPDAEYVMMNIPYGDFYDAVAPEAEQATAEAEDGVDGISTATKDKMTGTTGLAKGTYNNGESMLGVYYPVKMSEADYEVLTDSGLNETQSYYFRDLDEEPACFLSLDYRDGEYVFDAAELLASEPIANTIEVTDLTCTGGYGDYQITLEGVSTDGLTIDGVEVTIAGAILTADDGTSCALYVLNNMWWGSRIEYMEMAWSVIGGQELHLGHGSGPLCYQYDMNGKTLEKVTLVTDQGIYEIDCELALPEYYTGEEEILVEAEDGDEAIAVQVPEVFEDVKVSVSYTSGRSSVYVAQDAEIADGKVTLDEPIDCAANGSYTITITSSNFAPKTVTLEAPMTDAQREALTELVQQGEDLLTQVDHSLLAEHVAEAKELLADPDAASSEAAELISELEGYIAEAEAMLTPAEDESPKDEEQGAGDGNSQSSGNQPESSDGTGAAGSTGTTSESAPAETGTSAVTTTKLLQLRAIGGTKRVTLKWNKVNNADGYLIYGARCGVGYQVVADVTDGTAKKYVVEGLEKGKSYKYRVKAYKIVDGEQVILRSSNTTHVYTHGNKKYANAKKVTASKTSVSLSVGKTGTIEATITMANSKKKLTTHVKELRYRSNNRKVATVSSTGVITAVKAGTANIYAYSPNGRYAKVTVTVK